MVPSNLAAALLIASCTICVQAAIRKQHLCAETCSELATGGCGYDISMLPSDSDLAVDTLSARAAAACDQQSLQSSPPPSPPRPSPPPPSPPRQPASSLASASPPLPGALPPGPSLNPEVPSAPSPIPSSSSSPSPSPPPASATGCGSPGWETVWYDNFDTLDATKWSPQMYDGAQYQAYEWGNQEAEWYTNRTENVRVENGALVLQAQLENSTGADWEYQNCWDECRERCQAQGNAGAAQDTCVQNCAVPRCDNVKSRAITSARIRTYGKFSIAPSVKYSTVRVEASMALPQGPGLWPAFWLLPETGATDSCSGCGMYGTWASSGEIDVMESVNNMDTVTASLHYGGAHPNNEMIHGRMQRMPPDASGFQQYAVEWERTVMRWYQGGVQYFTASSRTGGPEGWFSAASPGTNAPFNTPFHLIFNLAVGGSFPNGVYQQQTGQPLALSTIQQTLGQDGKQFRVDYVRVCGKVAPAAGKNATKDRVESRQEVRGDVQQRAPHFLKAETGMKL